MLLSWCCGVVVLWWRAAGGGRILLFSLACLCTVPACFTPSPPFYYTLPSPPFLICTSLYENILLHFFVPYFYHPFSYTHLLLPILFLFPPYPSYKFPFPPCRAFITFSYTYCSVPYYYLSSYPSTCNRVPVLSPHFIYA